MGEVDGAPADPELDGGALRERIAARLGRAASELRPVAAGRDFHVLVVDGLVIRVPRRRRALVKLGAERTLLEALAPRLGDRVPRPRPLADLSPLFAYPWIAGVPAGRAAPGAGLVGDLAGFLAVLHATADPPGYRDPEPGTVVARLQAAVAARYLDGVPYTPAERAAVERLLASPLPVGPVEPCLMHGDLAARNVIIDERGRLAGVIDWSDSAVTDPAIDFGALAYWAGPVVLDALLARTGRPSDAALRERALLIGGLLGAIELVEAGRAGDPAEAAVARQALAGWPDR